MQTITGQWDKKGYLIKDKKRIQKQVKHKSQRHLGYAIKKEIIEELGFDFSVSHNPYAESY
ncbi:pathogenicity island protein [Staphylococcus aureus]|nr:pathogenicity island protein [Staphylococcus aureus]